jgi:hypothetical protein
LTGLFEPVDMHTGIDDAVFGELRKSQNALQEEGLQLTRQAGGLVRPGDALQHLGQRPSVLHNP